MSEIDWSKCPEATHFDPVGQNFLREIDRALLLFNSRKGWTVPIHTQYGVTIEDCHRPLIKRPEWDGEGLPPAGAACELSSQGADWGIGTILYTAENLIVWRWERQSEGQACASYRHEVEIRPIRTAEQIVADERLHKIRNAHTRIARTLDQFKMDIPGQSTARAVIEAMINAGYEKQEAV